jgi:hypothetical protein
MIADQPSEIDIAQVLHDLITRRVAELMHQVSVAIMAFCTSQVLAPRLCPQP